VHSKTILLGYENLPNSIQIRPIGQGFGTCLSFLPLGKDYLQHYYKLIWTTANNPTDCRQLSMDFPPVQKQSTGLFLHQSADWCYPFKSYAPIKKVRRQKSTDFFGRGTRT